jgi:hypothetical protein
MKSRLVVALFSAWVVIQLLDGPIRFALVAAGVPSLLYLKDVLLVAALGRVCALHGFGPSLVAGLAVIAAAGSAGVLQSRPMAQVLFAAKVAVPYLFGAACGPLISDDAPGRRARLALGLAFLAVVGGVFVNQALEWPWEGMQYAIDGVGAEVQGTKVWSHMGVKRIAGFSRSSYDAAVAIALLAVALIASRDRLAWGVAVLGLAAFATVVTTTKGILLNLAIVALVFVVRAVAPRVASRFLVPSLAALFASVVVLLPLLSLVGAPFLDTSTEDRQFLLKSMNDRLESCWPEAFDLIVSDGNLLTGRGLGGLGIPQLYYETNHYNPCDNLSVFLIGNYGLLGTLFLPFLAWRVALLARMDGRLPLLLSLSGLLILSYGMTANVLESPFLALLVGLVASRGSPPSTVPARRAGSR